MLLEGAMDRIAEASGALTREDPATFGSAIGKAISILDSLRVSLDNERGGQIAENLSALYDYMTRRLLEANATKDDAFWNALTDQLSMNDDGELVLHRLTPAKAQAPVALPPPRRQHRYCSPARSWPMSLG